MSEQTTFNYRNHRGIFLRSVRDARVEWIPNPGFHYQPGWFLTGWDVDRQGVRSFALSSICLADASQCYTLLQGAAPDA